MKIENPWKGYNGREIPLKSYATLVVVFNSLLGWTTAGTLKKQAAQGNPVAKLPPSERVLDLVLLGTAVHKLSRIIAREAVTAPMRAPFTHFLDFLGYGEVLEESRGGPIRSTIGDLLSCNYCTDMWVGLAFLNLERFAPGPFRFLTRFFTAVTLADFLHVHYETTRSRENVLTLREKALEKKKKAA